MLMSLAAAVLIWPKSIATAKFDASGRGFISLPSCFCFSGETRALLWRSMALFHTSAHSNGGQWRKIGNFRPLFWAVRWRKSSSFALLVLEAGPCELDLGLSFFQRPVKLQVQGPSPWWVLANSPSRLLNSGHLSKSVVFSSENHCEVSGLNTDVLV